MRQKNVLIKNKNKMAPCGNCLGLYDRPSPGYSRGYPGSVYDCYCSEEDVERGMYETKLLMAYTIYKNRIKTLPDDKDLPSLKFKLEETAIKYMEKFPDQKAALLCRKFLKC